MKNIFFIVISIFSSHRCFSQSPYFRKHPLPLEFKNAEVHCVLQDKNHFLWLGTSQGLIRYNGISYKHFLQFPNEKNEISAMFESGDGTLWIGYEDGKIGRLKNVFLPVDSTLNIKEKITGFAEIPGGAIWVSTYGQGLKIISRTGTNSITTSNGLSDNFVYGIVASQAGKIFAGTDVGLSECSMNGKNVKVNLAHTRELRDNIITTLSSHDSLVWIGSESNGIARMKNLDISYPVDSWEYGRVTAILPLGETVWVGTAMHGIIEVDVENHRAHPIVSRGLPKRITDLYQDQEGNIWICSGAGVIHSGNMTFSFLSDTENANTNIQALHYCRNNNIWYSTPNGVYTVDLRSGDKSIPVTNPELREVQIISFAEDDAGNIWMGSFDKGVFILDPKTKIIKRLTEKHGLINNNVLSIAHGKGSMWFATLGGVSELKLDGTNRFQNYTSEHGLGSNYIYKVFIDSKNRIWFATDGKGITMLNDNKFRNFSLSEGLKSNIIYSVTEDATGTIWLSTANAGIFRWNGEQFQSFVPHNGLRDLSISSIIGDKHNNILIVSKNGIDILDPKTGAVFYHGDEFGISEIDPNLNAYDVDPGGNIWIGTQNGIIKYNATIKPMKKWPVTTINEVQLFLSKTDTTEKKFAHNDNHISFDYLGFWYHDPAEVSYKLKLLGYDREWIYSKNHFITYPNLPPGDYTFIVQSSATNHFDGAIEKRYNFTIAAPFYNSFWFYAACVLLVTGFTYWFIKRRETNLKAKERLEKEKIEFQFQTLKNQVNPHFLFNSFNTLIGVIEQDQSTAVEYVEKLSDFYRDILVNREKNLIPLSKELEMIDNYYFLQLKRYRQNFTIRVAVPEGLKESSVAPLTLQLLVENAIKHNIISTDKPLLVEIFEENNHLVVRNNLQRKTVAEPSTGVGLNNIVNRYKLLSEKPVRIIENETHFSVYVPLLTS